MNMTTEKPFACKSDGCGMSFTNEDHLSVHEKKHEMMLNLSLSGQKSGNIFVADQTPTPTRLIRNCEEVGLFDDLRHVNPFDETFRRAVEQKSEQASNAHIDGTETDRNPEEDSLHTPQVFPQLDANDDVGYCDCVALQKLPDGISAAVTLDVPAVEHMLTENTQNTTTRNNSVLRQNSSTNWGCGGKLQRYRSIAEKPPAAHINVTPGIVQLPASIQLIQPQVITLSFSSNTNNCSTMRSSSAGAATIIPVQTVKPFIMPKLAPTIAAGTERSGNVSSSSTITAPAVAQPEPSSASLTPTSQLPIKERLKVILSNSSKSRIIELPQKTNVRRSRTAVDNGLTKCDDDFMERRRAASTRYRVKMRGAHEDLRRQNVELLNDNDKLRQRVKQLENELTIQRNTSQRATGVENNQMLVDTPTTLVPSQIQIPPSTIHLVMNIPKLIIPPNGAPIMHNPITFKVEKK